MSPQGLRLRLARRADLRRLRGHDQRPEGASVGERGAVSSHDVKRLVVGIASWALLLGLWCGAAWRANGATWQAIAFVSGVLVLSAIVEIVWGRP